MPEHDAWFWLLTLTVGVVAGAVAALRSIRIARLVEDTPTSRIRSAAQGYVELTGRGEPLPGTQNLGPLTQRPCIWWRYRVAKRKQVSSRGGGRESWETMASGTSSIPFLLDDGTGQCIVKPEGAEILTTEATTWYGDTPWPAGAPGSGGISFTERDYRYVEERIYQHEQVYALGEFRSTTATAEQDTEAAQASLLDDWKHDQPALLQRFDNDRDGRISLAEWEEARRAARRTVEQQRSEAAPHEVHHVLCRPADGQLFLLAALPRAELARRYRRRAMIAFCGFVAGVYALGWLLQHGLD